ncbi:MAG: PleD family two-component system response regulator [Hyphomonadaceae bacterium]
MSARVLVVDDIEANRRLLEAKLAREYFQVIVARDGLEALTVCRAQAPDIVLLDVMMPGMDGFEVCRQLKEDAATRHIPVLMVTALDERESRLKALEYGADDYLTKPVDDAQLLARLRSLARMKPIIDELRAREASGRRFGLSAPPPAVDGDNAQVLLIDDDARQSARIARVLSTQHRVSTIGEGAQAKPDVIIVSVASAAFDGLRVIVQIRADEPARRLAVLAVADADDKARAARALDLGADDVVYRPIDLGELSARVRTLAKRKRHLDAMSAALDRGLEAAVIDPLTGLHNRRYLDAKLGALLRRATTGKMQLTALALDLDHFKAINDAHGHEGGDAVLCAFAQRLSAAVRPLDLVCRAGGEEFIVLMPGASADVAALAAERLRRRLVATPYMINDTHRLDVTVSIGVAVAGAKDTPASLLRRADEALYLAKNSGRNRVMAAVAEPATA